MASLTKKLKLDPRQRRFELRNDELLLTGGASSISDDYDQDDSMQHKRRGAVDSSAEINCLLNSTGRKNTRGYKQGAMVYIVPTVHTAMLQPEINLASL